ncbi:16145_t:CDS:1, partial [Racocetra persica]
MPLDLQKQLKNHFLIGFVLFEASFNDFIKPVLQKIKRLENGLVIETLIKDAWVVGRVGYITADLPQGNNLA